MDIAKMTIEQLLQYDNIKNLVWGAVLVSITIQLVFNLLDEIQYSLIRRNILIKKGRIKPKRFDYWLTSKLFNIGLWFLRRAYALDYRTHGIIQGLSVRVHKFEPVKKEFDLIIEYGRCYYD